MRVVGARVPETGHGLPTDTLGRYADTTASYRGGASHHHTAYEGGRHVVASQRRAREQRVIMICCRRAAVCAATVRAEATARQVNIAPSPIIRNCSPTVTACLPLCMSLAANPVQTRRHKTKSRRRIRTGAEEEDFRICSISGSNVCVI
jgi:hypothetical protein